MNNKFFKLLLGLVFLLLFVSLPKSVSAEICYETRCIDWNQCCLLGEGNIACPPWQYLYKSCCETYGQVEVPCPCDNSCDGTCTLACPAGQSTVVSGELCKQNQISCTYRNDCNNTCTRTGTQYCYLPETNLASFPPSQPANIKLNLNGLIYTLSTDPANPTNIDISSLGDVDALLANDNKTTKLNNAVAPVADGYPVSQTDGRLPLGAAGRGDDAHVIGGAVIEQDGVYKMWYSASDGSNYRIYYATSTNGIRWTKYDNTAPAASDTTSTNGRVPIGTSGKGDDVHVRNPWVIDDSGTLKMWYSGYDGANWRIFHATSDDGGLTWSKRNNTNPANSDTTSTDGRIPRGTSGKGDSTHLLGVSVIKDGDTYKMWYSASNGSNYRIYYATSPDGLIWTKRDNVVPVASDTTSTNGRIPLGTNGKGDDAHVRGLSVVKVGGVYKMWYSASDGSFYRTFFATSNNGIDWTKRNNVIPVDSDTVSPDGQIPQGLSGKGDDDHVYFPYVIYVDGQYKIWYAGEDGSINRVYYATSSDGLNISKYNNNIPGKLDSVSTSGRLALGSDTRGDDAGIQGVSIVKDGTYKMWYSGYDGSTWRIYHATSTDGFKWNKYDNEAHGRSDTVSSNGRLGLGNSGKGDDVHVRNPWVIKDGGTYKMWYSGYDGANWRIFFATSGDGGLTWNKMDNNNPANSDTTSTNGRIPRGSNTKGDDAHILSASVIKDGGTYKMWYSASDGNNYRVYYATSSNGTDWSKYNNTTPANSDTTSTNGTIPRGTGGSGDDTHIQSPTVTKEDSLYKMWYSGSDGSNWRIYYAYSLDGINWQKVNNAIPANSNTISTEGRIPRGTSGGDTTHVSDPFVLIDGGEYRMWYSGSNGSYREFYAKLEKDYLVQVFLPKSTAPLTARALGYEIRADNYGTKDAWVNNLNCSSISGEDFCVRSTTDNYFEFLPTSVPLSEVLVRSGAGKIAGLYYHLDKCDDDRVYSLPIEGYYQINSSPVIVDPCDTNPAIAADDPSCPESEVCDMEPDKKCTIDEIVPEKSLCNGRASDTWYTGKTLNNPLKIRVGGTDDEGPNDVKGLVVWFDKGNSIQKTSVLTDSYDGTPVDNFAILIKRNGSDWSNPDFYGFTGTSWGKLQEQDSLMKIFNKSNQEIGGLVKNDDGNFVKIYIDKIITFELQLLFKDSANLDHPGGEYEFNVELLDSASLTNTDVYLSSITRLFNWGIDLQDPNISNFREEIIDPTHLDLKWEVDGTYSEIVDYVINAYRIESNENTKITDISMESKNMITFTEPYEVPEEQQIGLIGDLNSWQFNDLSPTSNIYTDEGTVNIGVNELGAIAVYGTAYDNACNVGRGVLNVNLDPWFATKGGTVYSKGYSGTAAKDMPSGLPADTLRSLLTTEVDKASELIMSRHQLIESFLRSNSAVRVVSTNDYNDKKNFWYTYLTRKLEQNTDTIFKEINNINECSIGENCILESASFDMGSNSVTCNGRILVIAKDTIRLRPGILRGDAMSGCIFFSKNNIEILGGSYKSTGTTVQYDYIDAFLIAENKISLEYADIDKDIRDGLEIKGGVVALGRDLFNTPAVEIKRNLRLYNYSYPTLVITVDPKYADISKTFFGTEAPMYKQEVGFKGL